MANFNDFDLDLQTEDVKGNLGERDPRFVTELITATIVGTIVGASINNCTKGCTQGCSASCHNCRP